MLVLTRQKNQSIIIGNDVEITIVDVRGDKVRIGIKAPTSVPVHRKEVYEAIVAANIEAASAGLEEAARIDKLLSSKGVKPPAKEATEGKPLQKGRKKGDQ